MAQRPLGSELVGALESSWEAIGERHPDLPPAVIVTGAGSAASRGELRLGQFAAGRWAQGEQDGLAEVFLGGEGLGRGAARVLGTLLHESAHALAHQRAIKDTSRQGRYHNRRFAALAQELGLEVEHDRRLGWSLTSLPIPTAKRYASAIATLERVLAAHRERERSPAVVGDRQRFGLDRGSPCSQRS